MKDVLSCPSLSGNRLNNWKEKSFLLPLITIMFKG
jgi:hypothetical protein